MKYTISTSDDVSEILTDRVLIITGVGRSGTSIFGKIIGSMSPVYYLFEPAIMKWIFSDMDSIWLRAIIFEDYLLPIVQAHHLNDNFEDLTYWRDYYIEDEIMAARKYLNRRQNAIAFLKLKRPLFVIKTNEFQPLMSYAEEIFPGCRFIHIVRNGNNVIQSAIDKGWYTDEWCNNYMIDWSIGRDVKASWYLDEEIIKQWPKWTPITRAACIWRCLVDNGITFLSNTKREKNNLFYEDFATDPESDIKEIRNEFDLEITENTEKHINAVYSFQQKIYPYIVDNIEEPEYSKFLRVMNWCGYDT